MKREAEASSEGRREGGLADEADFCSKVDYDSAQLGGWMGWAQ